MSRSNTGSVESPWPGLLAASFVAVCYFLYAHYPAFVEPYCTNNDAPQHLLWMFDVNWAEPFYAETSGRIQPWGYLWLNRFFLLFLDPILLSYMGVLLSLLLTVNYSFLAFRQFFPTALALAAALFAGHLAYAPSVGYFSRAFCVPTIAIFTHYFLLRQAKGVALSWLVGALFYPPALLVCLGIFGLHVPWFLYQWRRSGLFLGDFKVAKLLDNRQVVNEVESTDDREKMTDRSDRPFSSPQSFSSTLLSPLLILGVGAFLSLAIVLAKSAELRMDPWIGPFVSAKVITTDAEFGSGGRVNFRHELKTTTPAMIKYTLRRNLRWSKQDWPYWLGGIIFLFSAWWWRKQKIARFDAYLIAFVLSASILHGLAKELVPLLFLPDRFFRYPGHFLGGVILARLLFILPLRWQTVATTFALTGFVFLYGPYIKGIYRRSLDQFKSTGPVFEELAKKPEGSMVAAPPYMADLIPVFAEQSVLISNESAHAL
ncbi:MAG: hypothetical protein AAFU03_02730, partial [Bacteroidota bacterium]